jgi:hypothetical protein
VGTLAEPTISIRGPSAVGRRSGKAGGSRSRYSLEIHDLPEPDCDADDYDDNAPVSNLVLTEHVTLSAGGTT